MVNFKYTNIKDNSIAERVSIFEASGKEVLCQSNIRDLSIAYVIPIDTLDAGNYFLTVRLNRENKAKQLVVK